MVPGEKAAPGTTPATVGLVLGIPGGFVVATFVWRLVANSLGISTTTASPTLALLVTVIGALALVNLIAFFPARAAAHTRPAIVLRSE